MLFKLVGYSIERYNYDWSVYSYVRTLNVVFVNVVRTLISSIVKDVSISLTIPWLVVRFCVHRFCSFCSIPRSDLSKSFALGYEKKKRTVIRFRKHYSSQGYLICPWYFCLSDHPIFIRYILPIGEFSVSFSIHSVIYLHIYYT